MPLSPSRPLRVVLADDAARVRAHLVALLETFEGLAVVAETDSGPSTLAAVRHHRPDLVVLDISMPGGNGLTVLAAIREELPDTQVIMMTNHDNPFYRKKCLAAGAAHFLDKASSFEVLSQLLEQHFGAQPRP